MKEMCFMEGRRRKKERHVGGAMVGVEKQVEWIQRLFRSLFTEDI